MDFELNRFQQEHYAEYASWFADPELNRHLGPIDQGWLDAVLSQPESAERYGHENSSWVISPVDGWIVVATLCKRAFSDLVTSEMRSSF